MATLVGRDAWLTLGVLRFGRVIEQHFNPDYCVLVVNSERVTCASSSLALTRTEAIRHCEENRDYWADKVQQLINDEVPS